MIEARVQFVTFLETSARNRILSAKPLETFSNRDGKTVELVSDINGSNFIRRNYSAPALGIFQRRSFPFPEALTEMCQIFEGAGIGVVPHVVLEPFHGESRFPIIVATEYLEDDITTASTEVKAQVARALGKIPSDSSEFHPGIEIFSSDMFRRKSIDGSEELVLVDVDPYLDDKVFTSVSEDANDVWNYGYIRKISELLWNFWCQRAERKEIIGAFFRSLVTQPGIDFDPMGNSRTSKAVMIVHDMAQGVDGRLFH